MDDSLELNSEQKKKQNNLALFDIGTTNKGPTLDYVTHHSHITEEQLEGLNDDQRNMVIKMNRYLRGEIIMPFFLAQGGGGTGKSFTIVRALANINVNNIIAAAPSHFAKNVLQEFLGEQYTVTTVAALLGKKVSYDANGKEILVRIRKDLEPPICNFQIIIVDEGSMIDDDTANEIIEYVRAGNKALLILGDYCQLPPVNQPSDSMFFDDISAELTIPMRFQGPIYEVTNLIRNEIIKIRNGLYPVLNILNTATDRISKVDPETGSGYIFLNKMPSMLAAAVRRFKKGRGTNYVRILAYRNKTIEKLNNNIRVGLYGDNPIQFEHGELLINNGGFSISSKKSVKTIITNGELFEVESATDIIGPFDIPCKELTFANKALEVPIYAVATEGEELYNNTMKRLVGLAQENPSAWADVYNFKESFAYFNYSYATSIHKAQGSTINHVFVMEDDILDVKMTTTKEKLQSLYVALSRSNFRVYIYNGIFKVNNSTLDQEVLKIDI